jgi:hypothetical protein
MEMIRKDCHYLPWEGKRRGSWELTLLRLCKWSTGSLSSFSDRKAGGFSPLARCFAQGWFSKAWRSGPWDLSGAEIQAV